MTLKFIIDNEADVPVALKDEYEPRDGRFYLKIEGDDRGAKVKEFRDRNTSLLKEKSDWEKQRALFADALRKHNVDPDELLRRGVDQEEAARRLRAAATRQQIALLALEAGARREAAEDVGLIAERHFTVDDDGALRPRRDDGEGDPKRWIDALKNQKPHLFEQSRGGGAQGGNSRALTYGQRDKVITNRAQLKTAAEKAKFLRENGVDKYMELEP